MAGDPRFRQPRGSSGALRVVVDMVGERDHGQLAESRFVERPFLPGGEHNMYEFAFAAAARGYEVELRGWLEQAAFDRLEQATGIAPRVGLPARRPDAGDLVIVPEGWQDPLEYARLLLSPARLALFLLAPPGLFGWDFTTPAWTRPDPLTVAIDAVAQPAHFQAMHALGISLLTHSPGLVAAAQAAGVPCTFVGVGRPDSLPPPPGEGRTIQTVALTANRWAPLVDQVVGDLDGVRVDLIGPSSNEEILRRLAQARVLLWPSRIEGHATIPWEARSVGCVPVALSTNRFAVGLSEESGAVVVDRVEQIAPAVRDLLADEPRWRELSDRASRTAPSEVEWETYVERVGRLLESIPAAAPEHAAYAGMGAALTDWSEMRAARAQAALEELRAEEQLLRADRDRLVAEFGADRGRLVAELAELGVDRHRVAVELGEMRANRDVLEQHLLALRNRRAVRIALRLAALKPGD